MKNLFLGLLMFVGFSQISCKKDSPAAPSIVGKWTLQNEKTKITAPGTAPTEETTPGSGATAELKAGGILTTCFGAQCYDLNYKVDGKKLSISETTDFTNAQVYDIQTLNSSTLVLYNKSIENVMGDDIVTEKWTTFSR